MAGAYSYKGDVEFGKLRFPVVARSAVKPREFRFNKHHADCGGQLKMAGMYCPTCGETNIESDQIVRGFGGVAGVDEQYIEDLALEKTPLIELTRLIPMAQVDPRYFQKSYNVMPDKGGEQQYVLFLRVLQKMKLVAQGEVVMSGKLYPVIFRALAGSIAMEVLYWPEELVPAIEAETAIEGIEVAPKVIKLGEQLAEAMVDDFEPAELKNQYAEDLQEYLDGFVAGNQPTPIKKATRKSLGRQSLEDALSASLEALPAKPKARAKKSA